MEQKLPNGVRQSMSRQRDTIGHPSPDLLTAFAERNLSAAEQAETTQHLASCADCREVVFLSTLPIEQTQTVLQPQPARRWRAWVWALPTAAMLAIVSISLVELNREAPTSKQIAQTTTVAPHPAQQSSAPVANETQQPPEAKRKEVPARVTPRQQSETPEPQSRVVAEQRRNAEPSPSVVGGIVAATPVPAPPARADRPAVVAAPKPAEPLTDSAKKADLDTLASANAAPQPAAAPARKQELARADIAQKVMSRDVATFAAAPTLSKAPRVKWRISPEGYLERSASPNEWSRVLANETVEFRVVAVNGMDVWAAGTRGAIFRSTDAGAHWTKVPIEGVNGTVVSIHFSDPFRAVLRLESGAQWITEDGGISWVKKH